MLQSLPRQVRGGIGVCLGGLAWRLRIRRRVVLENLATAFPGLPQAGQMAIGKRCFRHFGAVGTSLAALPSLEPTDVGKWIHFTGLEAMDRAVAGGKGGIVVSGHLGNWEIVGAACAKLGYPVSFVVTTQSNKSVEKWLDNQRAKCGVEIIKRREALRGVLSALKRNRIVAILIDQDAHEDGVFVPFFGKPSSTPRGPAVFYMRTGAPLIFMESQRLPGEEYRVRLADVIPPENATQEEIMTILNARLEEAVRRTPEQWFWMHRRWKTSPPKSS